MESAGFTAIDETDSTDQYLKTLRAWVEHSSERESELVALWGRERFTNRQATWRTAIGAVEEGLLRRALLSGTKRQKP
jgi:hypothetical protein